MRALVSRRRSKGDGGRFSVKWAPPPIGGGEKLADWAATPLEVPKIGSASSRPT
jgi:hypothetical protein